jgi:hypothetical protein
MGSPETVSNPNTLESSASMSGKRSPLILRIRCSTQRGIASEWRIHQFVDCSSFLFVVVAALGTIRGATLPNAITRSHLCFRGTLF